MAFCVQVGLYQGSVSSPFLFTQLLDVLTEGLRCELPWTLLYADDGFLCRTGDEELNMEAEKRRNSLEERGLRVNRINTAGMRCDLRK